MAVWRNRLIARGVWRLGLAGLACVAALALGVSGASAISAGTGGVVRLLPVTNGTVVASAVSGSTLYIGGAFSEVGPNTGAFSSINASTGKATPPQSPFNGGVSAIVSDRHGGWYVGRPCSARAIPAGCLTHVLAGGAIDSGFKPVLGEVGSLALSPDGKRLYVGAFFLKAGVPVNEIGALNATTGQRITQFATVAFDAAQPPPIALSPDGSVLYLGVTTLNGASVYGVGAVRTSDGHRTSFRAPSDYGNIESIAVSPDGKVVYAAGDSGLTGQPNNHSLITAYHAGTGVAVRKPTRLDANTVFSLAFSPDGSTLYAGGTFTKVGQNARLHLAAFNTSSWKLEPFDPGADNGVHALAVAPNGTVYLGGNFTSVGGEPRLGVAAVTPAGAVTAWDPHADGPVAAIAVAPRVNHPIGVGGAFDSIGSATRDYIAAVDLTTGKLAAFNPGATDPHTQFALGTVDALAASPDGKTLYVGGVFSAIGGQSRSGIAALSIPDGMVESFDAGPAISSVHAEVLSPDGATLYVAGVVGSSHSAGVAAISTATSVVSVFPPLPANTIDSLALSSDGSTLYAGGLINFVPGHGGAGVLALSTASEQPVGGFDAEGSSGGDVTSLALSPDGSTLYAGGLFTDFAGQPRACLTGLDPVTGAAKGPDFDLAAGPGTGCQVRALAFSTKGKDLYLGGGFDSAGGAVHHRLVEVDLTTGQATTFAPRLTEPTCCSFDTDEVLTLSRYGSTLAVGGGFGGVNGNTGPGIALFNAP